MSSSSKLAEIRALIQRNASVADVRAAIRSLESLFSGQMQASEAGDVLHEAFVALRYLSAFDASVSADILAKDMLPWCIGGAVQDRAAHQRLEQLFGDWLKELPEEARSRVREHAISELVGILSREPQRAIGLLSAIGYADSRVIEVLENLIKSSTGEVRGRAISLRGYLRPTAEGAEWLRESLHDGIPDGPSIYLTTAARRLAWPDTGELLLRHWLPALSFGGGEWMPDVVCDLLIRLCKRFADSSLLAEVWRYLQVPQAATHLALNSGLAPRIELPAVVPDLIRHARDAEPHLAYLFHLRLCECSSPAHMRGWSEVPLADLDHVRRAAIQPSGVLEGHATIELDRKQTAWEVLLSRGERSALPSFEEALRAEPSAAVINEFLTLAGCTGLEELPGIVRDLVAAEPKEGWSERDRLIAQVGAIHAVHGAATEAGLDVLLTYRVVGKGVLLSAVNALADTAGVLAARGVRRGISRLLDNLSIECIAPVREAAAGALSILLERNLLDEQEIGRLATAGTTVSSVATRELFFAFSRQSSAVPKAMIERARDLVSRVTSVNEADASDAALVLVALRTAVADEHAFLVSKLGLDIAVDGSVNTYDTFVGGVVPYVVATYFASEPERFAVAIGGMLRRGPTGVLFQILPFIKKLGSRCPVVVVNEMVARVRRASTGAVSEGLLLHALAEVAPERLLIECCNETQSWLPQARVDLANAIAGVRNGSAGLEDARAKVLIGLMADSTYAVRRAAYRSAAASCPEALADLAQSLASWQQGKLEGPRRRAAESVEWLAEVADGLRALEWDVEPSVREAYEWSMEQREQRLRAAAYEDRILMVNDPKDILSNWRYGVALARLGDDGTVRRLDERLRARLHPAVLLWLTRIRKAVDRRWNDVTRKWPDPWFARSGHLEKFSGVLNDGKEQVSVEGTLWRMDGELPDETSSWGGWGQSGVLALAQRSSEWDMLIPGRSSARVLVTSAQLFGGDLVFVGNGLYPEVQA